MSELNPITREEVLLDSVANGTPSNLTPITRQEMYLSAIAGETELPSDMKPITREEEYYQMILDNGGAGGGGEATGTKTINITANGTTSHNVKAYATAEIITNVPNSYESSDEGKVVSNGALVSQTSQSITANGTYDTTTKNSVSVAVPTGITPSGSQTFTENGTYDVTSLAEAVVNVASSGGLSMDDLASGNNPSGRVVFTEQVITTLTFGNATNEWTAFFKNTTYLDHDAIKYCKNLKIAVFPDELTGGVGGGSTGIVSHNEQLEVCDFKYATRFTGSMFISNTMMDTLILRQNSVVSLTAITGFNNTPFANGKAGGTLYVPQALISDYQSATNWSTILGYTNNQILAIEGSAYENAYADGTAIE